jgi:hypothetical protein
VVYFTSNSLTCISNFNNLTKEIITKIHTYDLAKQKLQRNRLQVASTLDKQSLEKLLPRRNYAQKKRLNPT